MADDDFTKYISMLVCRARGQTFGIYAESVFEILRLKEIRVFKVPKMTPGVLGLFNLRGEIIPVFDLVERMNFMNGEIMVKSSDKASNRLIVASIEGALYGVLVDAVLGISEANADLLEPVYLIGVEFSCVLEGETVQIVKLDELIA
jgi:chemotaxis signal transduction protein